MTETKRPLKVFLCHAHADRNAVRALYTRLTSDGIDAWLDKEKILPGQEWRPEIEKAVREADAVVVCLSNSFNRDGFRQKEVVWALDKAEEKREGTIYIIPACLEDCDLPQRLAKYHKVDLFEDKGYQLLIKALKIRANEIGVITYSFRRSDLVEEFKEREKHVPSRDNVIREDKWADGRPTSAKPIKVKLAYSLEINHSPLGIAFSPDGQILAAVNREYSNNIVSLFSGYENSLVTFWNAQDGEALSSNLVRNNNASRICFSDKRKVLLAGDYGNNLNVRYVGVNQKPGPMITIKVGDGLDSRGYSISHDGNYIFSNVYKSNLSGPDFKTEVWHSNSGSKLASRDQISYSLAFNSDGRSIVGFSYDRFIIWDFHQDKLQVIPTQRFDARLLAISPNGEKIATAGNTRNIAPENQPFRIAANNSRSNQFPRLNLEDMRTSVVTIKLWQYSDGSLLHTLEGHTQNITSMAFSPDGRYLVSGGEDNSVRLWDTQNGSLLYQFENPKKYIYESNRNTVTQVAFSPDGMTFASTSLDRMIKVWKIN